MVRFGAEMASQVQGKRIAFTAGGNVNDSWTLRGIPKNVHDSFRAYGTRNFHHLNGEVIPAKALNGTQRAIQPELLRDIVLYVGVAVAVSAITGAGRSMGR